MDQSAPVMIVTGQGGVRPARPPEPAADPGPGFWGEDGFTFEDVLDLINPLHHIPLVSALYRDLTGDEIAPGPRILGAGLFSLGPVGAAIGMAGAAVDTAVERHTGRDLGGHVMALIGGDATEPEATIVAERADNLAAREAQPSRPADPVAAPMTITPLAAPATGGSTAGATPAITAGTSAPAPTRPGSRSAAAPMTGQATGQAPGQATTPILSNAQWAALMQQLEPAPEAAGTHGDIANRMSEGLDKYAAMVRARRAQSSGDAPAMAAADRK